MNGIFGKFIKNIYHPFLQKIGDSRYLSEYPYDLTKLPFEYKPGTVNSDYRYKKIKKNFEKYEVIKLKHLSHKASTLILGCGHDRLSYPTLIDPILAISDLENMASHSHPDAITVDVDLWTNPDIIASVGESLLAPCFKGMKFARIEFEGFFPRVSIKRTVIQDILQLLKNGGRILLTKTPFEDQDLTEQFIKIDSKEQNNILTLGVERNNWGQPQPTPIMD